MYYRNKLSFILVVLGSQTVGPIFKNVNKISKFSLFTIKKYSVTWIGVAWIYLLAIIWVLSVLSLMS